MKSSQDVFCEGRESVREAGDTPSNSKLVSAKARHQRDLDRYLSGDALIGDDFSPEEVAQWFADEKEACFEIRGSMKSYPYHEKNRFHAYRKLSHRAFRSVLSFGGGNGAELLPIADQIMDVTILEPSSNFEAAIAAKYVVPNVDGTMPFPDNSFDLITCFGVLHHIPTVSATIKEMYRCVAKGGVVLLSEPIISMNWTETRVGLTKHERGIPLHLMRAFLKNAGFKVVSKDKYSFGPLNFVNRKLDLSL